MLPLLLVAKSEDENHWMLKRCKNNLCPRDSQFSEALCPKEFSIKNHQQKTSMKSDGDIYIQQVTFCYERWIYRKI